MTIRYVLVDNKPFIEQIAYKPMVYFDNWTINKFLRDFDLKSRLLNIVNKKKFTVAFSIMNLFEMVARDDNKQINEIIDFISVFDDALIDSNPTRVISKEQLINNNPELMFNYPPWVDEKYLTTLVHGRCFKKLSVAEALYNLNNEINEFNFHIYTEFENDLFPIIHAGRLDKTRLSIAKERVKNKIQRKKSGIPYTKELYYYSTEYIVSNEKMKMGENEWRDLFHLIVPVSYCDFVFMDNRWIQFIKTTGLQHPDIAKVYGPRDINDFINDLDLYISN